MVLITTDQKLPKKKMTISDKKFGINKDFENG